MYYDNKEVAEIPIVHILHHLARTLHFDAIFWEKITHFLESIENDNHIYDKFVHGRLLEKGNVLGNALMAHFIT